MAALGLAGVRAFLEDQVIDQERLLAEVAAELAADRRTVRRLTQQTGVTRRRRTARQLAVGEQSRPGVEDAMRMAPAERLPAAAAEAEPVRQLRVRRLGGERAGVISTVDPRARHTRKTSAATRRLQGPHRHRT